MSVHFFSNPESFSLISAMSSSAFVTCLGVVKPFGCVPKNFSARPTAFVTQLLWLRIDLFGSTLTGSFGGMMSRSISLQSWYTPSMMTMIQFDSLVQYFFSTRTARISYAGSQNQSDTLTVSGLDIFFRPVPHEFPMWGALVRSQKEYKKFR